MFSLFQDNCFFFYGKHYTIFLYFCFRYFYHVAANPNQYFLLVTGMDLNLKVFVVFLSQYAKSLYRSDKLLFRNNCNISNDISNDK